MTSKGISFFVDEASKKDVSFNQSSLSGNE